MEDRELLELAAKAAGIKKDDSPYNGGGFGNDGFDCMGNMVLDWHNNKHWNPLTDDGDALRLAVKLKIHHRQYSNQVQIRGCWCRDGYIEASCKDIEEREPIGNDPYAATRRAIVRAAAEIGKAMT